MTAVRPTPAGSAPAVARLYVRGSDWAAEFLAYLEEYHLGSSRFGFEVDVRPGADVRDEILPWINLNQVSVQFGAPVATSREELRVFGVRGGAYHVAAFDYDAERRVATWTLDRHINSDVVNIRVSGGGGVLLDRTLPILPGDVDRGGTVVAIDFSEVELRLSTSTTNPGRGASRYSIFQDVDGSGAIDQKDLAEVKKRFFSRLPET